jgi:methylmalonyl-CoA mutase N-terminal domain/subunit
MDKIEKFGGIIKGVSEGYIQRLVARQAFESKKDRVRGTAESGCEHIQRGESMEVELHEYNWESAEKQIEALRAVKRELSEKDVSRTLKELESAPETAKT